MKLNRGVNFEDKNKVAKALFCKEAPSTSTSSSSRDDRNYTADV